MMYWWEMMYYPHPYLRKKRRHDFINKKSNVFHKWHKVNETNYPLNISSFIMQFITPYIGNRSDFQFALSNKKVYNRYIFFQETTCLEQLPFPNHTLHCYSITDQDKFKRKHWIICLTYFLQNNIGVYFNVNLSLKITTSAKYSSLTEVMLNMIGYYLVSLKIG